MDLQFSKFKKEYVEEQRELFRLSFPETKSTTVSSLDHYRWKFHSLDINPSSFEYACFKDQKMIGYYAAIPYRYKFQNKIFTGGMVCDVMTHPEARGMGVFTKLGHFSTDALKEQKLDFTTGYPIRPEVIPGHLKVGWEIAFDLPLYLTPLSSNLILKGKFSFFGKCIDFLVLSFWRIYSALFSSSSVDVRILSKKEALENVDVLEFLSNEVAPIQLIKDKPFLEWRLGAINSEYNFHVIKSNKEIKAIAIARSCVLKGVETYAVLDLVCADSDRGHLAPLLSSLRHYAGTIGRWCLAIMSSKHQAKMLGYTKLGLIKTPVKFQLIIKNLNLNEEFQKEFLKEENYRLGWIDSDDL